jgi:hypothetical protein
MSAKHKDTVVDLNIPYEKNDIQLKGILYFGVGLLLLILITFVLMWAFLRQMEMFAEENAPPANPLALRDKERLPPEPRLQGAPGFGVESANGWVNMELGAPQAEWWELKRQWDRLIDEGAKDAKTGAVIAMPMEEAKAEFLRQNVKARSDEAAQELLKNSQQVITEASAGRVAAFTIR